MARHTRIVVVSQAQGALIFIFGDEVLDSVVLDHASFFSWQMLAQKETLNLCLRPGMFIHLTNCCTCTAVMQGIVLHLPPRFIVQGFYE